MGTMIAIAVRGLLTKLAITMISEKMLEWAFFKLAEEIVESTDNPHDNEWLEKLKGEYYGSKE